MEFLISLVILFGVFYILFNMFKTRKKNKNFVEQNPKFKNAKVFDTIGINKLLVCEDGDLAISNLKNKGLYEVVNIKDIFDWDIIQDGDSQKKLGGAVAGGLLFGGIGLVTGALLGGNKKYVTDLKLILKTKDFHNPTKEIVFINTKTGKTSADFQMQKLQDLVGTLEFLADKHK